MEEQIKEEKIPVEEKEKVSEKRKKKTPEEKRKEILKTFSGDIMRGANVSLSATLLKGFKEARYQFPVLGRKLLEKKAKAGFVVAEVIMPNRQSQYYLIDTRFNAFTHHVDKNKEKLFVLTPLKDSPEKFVRDVNRIPVATFDWKSGLPVPIVSDYEEDFDEDYYNDLVMRARLVGGSEKLVEWLEQQTKVLKFIFFTNLGMALFLMFQWVGWI